ncbi:MAG: hypothetical protein J0L92_17860 [Deltaproteobacteria bacterium]|nr:hypothetical protein [Deltaproteobacteria bacterium]
MRRTNLDLGFLTCLSALSGGAFASACSGTHMTLSDAGAQPDAAVVVADDAHVVASPDAFASPDAARTIEAEPLEQCLLGGGELVEVARVFNNDVEDHGALVTFGVSDTGLLAAAGADGTLKFWTLDAELLGVVDGTLLTYGSEIVAPITDMTLSGDMVIAGDSRGLVAEIRADGSYLPRGGTTPDVAIAAVAYTVSSAGLERIAHAQHAEGLLPLTVRNGETVLELESGLSSIRDLAFAADGSLWVAGARAVGSEQLPAVEQRDAADPSSVLRTIEVGSREGGTVIELSTSLDGSTIAMLTNERLEVHHADGIRSIPFTGWAEIIGVGAALSTGGEVAFTLESDGTLASHAVREERELARIDVGGRPVAVRTDASNRLVVVGRSDAYLIAYACER